MKEKRLKLLTKILAIVIICLVSFIGVYVQKGNTMKNIVKEFKYSKDLSGYREFIFEVSDAKEVTDSEGKVVGNTDSYSDAQITSNSYTKTENKINPDESLNFENYEMAKKIIEERLKGLNVQDYNISLDGETGKIYLAIPENTETDHVASNLLQIGKFEIKDSEDSSKVFVSNDNLKKVSAAYNTETTGTTVFLQIEFDKDGKNTLKDISSGEYKTTNTTEDDSTEKADEESESEEKSEESKDDSEENKDDSEENQNDSENEEEKKDSQKKIALVIDDNSLITSSFDDPIENGYINLSMNQATSDTESINKTLKSASTIATVLNSGKMPLTYKISENNYIGTDITTNIITKVIYVFIALTTCLMALLIIKNKKRGILAVISFLGFIAINLLVIRYTNVEISIESIVAEVIVLFINYLINKRLLSIDEKDIELKNKLVLEEFKQTIIKLMPIFASAVVFAFVKWEVIATFGMILFWGIFLSIVYNFIVTKKMLED